MTDTIYKYLKVHNKPYGVNEIVSNLHNEYGKTAVQKALEKLVSDGKIFEKVTGKQKVYCVVQDTTRTFQEMLASDKELQAYASEVEGKLEEVEKEVKVQEALLTSMKSSMTIEEAGKEKAKLQESIAALTNKCDALMEASGTEDLTEKKKKAEKLLDKASREYRKRKRIWTDILDCVLENYSGTKTELYEEIGIEIKDVK